MDYVVLMPSRAAGLHREFEAARRDDRHVLTHPPESPVEVAAVGRHRREAGMLRIAASA